LLSSFNLMSGEAFVSVDDKGINVNIDTKKEKVWCWPCGENSKQKQYDCYKINSYEQLSAYFPEDLQLETAKACHYVPDEHHSLAAFTSVLAKELDLDHQIGQIFLEHDADVVIWDSYPLSFGAILLEVYIDGIPQFNTSLSVPINETSE
ncbi:46003_t:CDS:2, partial [Gigaspora margarita]